jgi:hypothetical protein
MMLPMSRRDIADLLGSPTDALVPASDVKVVLESRRPLSISHRTRFPNRHYLHLASRLRNLTRMMNHLRSGKLTYLEAYDRFLTQSLQGRMPGCGPAYYTKRIFFLTKHLVGRGFIMDQWLGRSINLLADREVVLFYQPRRKTPLKQRYVHKKNPCSTYEEFCEAVCNLTSISGETDSDVRVREENLEMRLFSDGRGKGKWREYVVANDISR